MKKILLALMGIGVIANFTLAQVTFDRSRVILDAKRGSSQSLVLKNEGNSPYLAQTWIEDLNGNKIVTPLAALPILQRLDPGQDKLVKINTIGSSAQLPSDRETMLELNVLGVPPKTGDGSNEVSIIILSKIKLFYRPKSLPGYEQNEWFPDIVIRKSGNSFTLENPSPYYTIIYAYTDSAGRDIEKDINLKPFSSETVSGRLGNQFALMVIDDYGANIQMDYKCDGNVCRGDFKDEYRRNRKN